MIHVCPLGVLLGLQGALLGQEAPTSFWSCGYPHMPPPTTQIYEYECYNHPALLGLKLVTFGSFN